MLMIKLQCTLVCPHPIDHSSQNGQHLDLLTPKDTSTGYLSFFAILQTSRVEKEFCIVYVLSDVCANLSIILRLYINQSVWGQYLLALVTQVTMLETAPWMGYPPAPHAVFFPSGQPRRKRRQLKDKQSVSFKMMF